MHLRLPRAAAAIALAIVTAACGRTPPDVPSTPTITLTPPRGAMPAVVDVNGLSASALARLGGETRSAEQWNDLLRVSVGDGTVAMLGSYTVTGTALRFTPAFPFDPGRSYTVRFDPATLGVAESGPVIIESVALAAEHTTPTTVVTRVYPTGDLVPENLLRMYIEFSGPMGRPSGIPHLRLLDDSGEEVAGAFLPLDYEFWNREHTRFTVFFDPGRVKGGILPNQQMGRALIPGKSATLVVSKEWRDEHGLPLKEEYRRVFRVGPADTQPLDTTTWRVHPPSASGRDPLVVTFPEPLDHGLLMRALGVMRDGQPIDGEISIDAGETRWAFAPKDPWRNGEYQLLALDILEDVAGNQIGRAFEVDNFDTVDKSPDPKSILIPFTIAIARTN